MTKDVLVSICGLQFEGDIDSDKIETIHVGSYYKKNNYHYVNYDEITEGFTENTKNTITFKEHELNLIKRGLVNVNMVFEENKKNITNYATPYGDILIGIDTERVVLRETEHYLQVKVDYSLEINYEHLANCKITLNISAKEDGISLQS